MAFQITWHVTCNKGMPCLIWAYYRRQVSGLNYKQESIVILTQPRLGKANEWSCELGLNGPSVGWDNSRLSSLYLFELVCLDWLLKLLYFKHFYSLNLNNRIFHLPSCALMLKITDCFALPDTFSANITMNRLEMDYGRKSED